jgi:hypothetical protein
VQSLPFVAATIMSMLAVLPLGRVPEQLPGIALGSPQFGKGK